MMINEPGSLLSINRFYSRFLKNFRSLYIYLPPSYGFEPDRHYPVLYMHDGQNIFDGSLSYSGDGWEIHQTADELIAAGLMEELIIVGIAHKEELRLSEYAHTDGYFQNQLVKGRGILYESFLTNDVMPFIEANFRVLSGRKNTGLMGSSMGGLVTFHIGLRRPDIFGKLGVVSPSFWWSPGKTLRLLKKVSYEKIDSKMWIDMGDQEGPLSSDFTKVMRELQNKNVMEPKNMVCWRVPEGTHSEKAWMSRSHCPLLFLFGKIGEAQELAIDDVPVVKMKERNRQILLSAVYTTGFCHTPYPASYSSSHPDVLQVTEEGIFKPRKPGEAVISATWKNMEVSRKFRVKFS